MTWRAGNRTPARAAVAEAALGGGRGCGARGYTLSELLAVIAVLAVLGSMTVGVFASLPARYAPEQAAATVRAALRRARAAALETRAEASVHFAKGRVEARAWKPLGLWRFEEPPAEPPPPSPFRAIGARGLDALVSGAVLDEGRFGNALWFETPGAAADCGNAPVFSPRDGVRLEAWIFPADPAKVRADAEHARVRPKEEEWAFEIAAKGDEYALVLREDGSLVARIGGERGLRIERETAAGAIPFERWTEVGLVFDGGELRILVDGLRRDLDPPVRDPAPPRLVATEAPLVISSPDLRRSFVGGIDEVALFGIVAEEGWTVPPDVRIEAPAAISFDARGALDPLHHDGPAAIAIRPVVPSPRAPPVGILVEKSGLVR